MRRAEILLASGCTILLAVSVAVVSVSAESPSDPGDVKALLELGRQFYYAGDSLPVRVSVGNDGDREHPNPVKGALLGAFVVRAAEGSPLKAEGKPKAQEPARPEKLAPRTFYGAVVDLAEIYPELRRPGRYEIGWAANGLSSQTIVVRVIQKYDPAKDYLARVETDEGFFVIELLGKTAPLATKSFVDLANSGYYDGLLFHEVRADALVVAGDQQGDGSGPPPIRYPADPTTIPVVAGAVLMKPVSPSPPTNGSQFAVMLRPEPAWKGQVTVFGQVVDGLDVVRKISRVAVSQTATGPYFKPAADCRIRKISIQERPPRPTT